MLLLRHVILAMGVCTLICVISLYADDSTKTDAASPQAETNADDSKMAVVNATVKLMDDVERDATKANATSEEKLAAERYQKVRQHLQDGKFKDAWQFVLEDPVLHHASGRVIGDRLGFLQHLAKDPKAYASGPQLRSIMAQSARSNSENALAATKLQEYWAWCKYLDYLNESTCRPDALTMAEIAFILDAERQPTSKEQINPDALRIITETFDDRLKSDRLDAIGKLVAEAIRLAPSHADTERMKLRLILCLSQRKTDFNKNGPLHASLGQAFISAARRRMESGEYEAARKLASDVLVFYDERHLSDDVDTPSKVLADIEPRGVFTSSKGKSPNSGTVIDPNKPKRSANLLLNLSFDPEKAEAVAAAQEETSAAQPHRRVIEVLLKLIDAVEQDAKRADATADEKLAAVRCQEAREALKAGNLDMAQPLLTDGSQVPLPGPYQKVLHYACLDLRTDFDVAATREFRQQRDDQVSRQAASYATVQCQRCLVEMNFPSYLAWYTLVTSLNEPTCRPDAIVMLQVLSMRDAERGRYATSETQELEKISEAFDNELKDGDLHSIGRLVAQAIQKAPKSVETERMKLRLVLRLALRDPGFIKHHSFVPILAGQFTSAARRRMVLGEYDAARLLASDALPLNIAIKPDADSPSKILADIQSSVAVTSSQAKSRNTGTVVDPNKPMSSANLLLNSSFEQGEDGPDHWRQSQPVDGVTWKWDKAAGFQSKSSLSLEKTAQRYFPIAEWYQTCELVPNTPMIHVSAKVKAEKLAKGVIDVSFGDQAGQPLHHQWVAYIGEEKEGPPLTHDWKLYEANVAVPPGTKTCQVRLQIYGPGKVWFDDVLLAPVRNSAQSVAGSSGSLPPGNTRAKPQPGANDPISIKVFVSHVNVEEMVARIKSDILLPDETDVTVESKIVDGKHVIALSGPERSVTQILVFITALDRPLKAAEPLTRLTDPKDEEMNRKTELLAKQVRESTGAEREKLKQDLEHLVEEHFKQRQARRTNEIYDLARRVDQMRHVQQKRQANQGEILKRRIEDLLDEDSLKWNETKSPLTPSTQVPGPVPTSASPPLSQSETVENKPTPALEESSEPTFDGLTYTAWLKILELDRNPKRVLEAVKALKEMPREQDAARLARGFFRFARNLPEEDSSRNAIDQEDAISSTNVALKRLPPEPVYVEMMNEIREGAQSTGSRKLVQRVIWPHVMPVAFKESLARHARELLGTLIESKGYTPKELFGIAISVLKYAKLRPRDIPDVAPLVATVLKEEETLASSNHQRLYYTLRDVAELDPEFPELVEVGTTILNQLRAARAEMLKTPGSTPLIYGNFGSGNALVSLGNGQQVSRPRNIQVCVDLIRLLPLLKCVRQEALPLLKEISATEWPQTEAFSSVQKEVLTDFKRIVDETIKGIEASIVSEQKSVDVKSAAKPDLGREPTFDGVVYSEWFNILEVERNPKKVLEAINALKEMAREQDAERLARGIFRFARTVPENYEGQLNTFGNVWLTTTQALKKLPPEPVVALMMEEIRAPEKSYGSRSLVRYMIMPLYELPDSFQECFGRHGKEILDDLVKSKGYSPNEIFGLSISVLQFAKLRPRDIEGLT
jgi:hypothetical protein